MDELKDQVIAVLLPAAGQGSRMGQPVNKLFLETAGEAVIVHTVRKVAGFAHSLQESPITAGRNNYTRVHLTLITREDEAETFRELLAEAGLADIVNAYTAGGTTRQDSVYLGLQSLRSADLPADTPVLIHDAARCLVPIALLRETASLAAQGIASAAALAVTDTLRRIQPGTPGLANLGETIDRKGAVRMQTPQAAPLGKLLEAHKDAADSSISATDDAALLIRMGEPVRMADGTLLNIKITRPDDLLFADQFLKG